VKKIFAFLFLILLFVPFIYETENNFLKVEVTISPRRLSRGEEGKAILKLKVGQGVLISPQPFFIIEFMPSKEIIFSKNFFTASDLEMEIGEGNEGEYLKLDEPVEIPFVVSLKADQGNHKLEGRIKYFARSQDEKWCLKNYIKFSASFYTRKNIVSKKK